ncbi:MAG: hypothetical protein SXV54_11585 [Chloroflexota bacterium]|nr:hypothetical protein [Chloroflexota bacterium]
MSRGKAPKLTRYFPVGPAPGPPGFCSFSGGLQPGAEVLNAEAHGLEKKIAENVLRLLEWV